MRETGCLPSVAVQSEREVVPQINTREDILEMVQRSPRLSTRRIASRIGVSRMQVWRTVHEEDLHPYHDQSSTSVTRGPCSAYGFVPLDNSTSTTAKRHVIQQ